MIMQEIWEDISEYEWYYQVSTFWNIRSLDRIDSIWRKIKWVILKTWISKWYLLVCLYKNSHYKSFSIHRLVAKTFIPNPENKRDVNHKNCIKTYNNIDNLEWMTVKENTQHAYNNWLIKPPSLWKKWILNHNSKKILQFDKSNNLIKLWNSSMDIKRELWIDTWCISKVCNWIRNYAWWFIWKFL